MRRSTAKRVDYSKEQDFSDEDIFGSDVDEKPTTTTVAPRTTVRKSKSRSSIDTSSNHQTADTSVDMGGYKQVYTEKGYDPTLPPIRDRFPFLPEQEEDGSPRIELIVGRRPVDDGENNDKDDSSPSKKKKSSPGKNNASVSGPVEYEYLVKYKGRSYLHLEWKTGADLESMNKSAKGIYRRWLKKLSAGTEEDLENPEFDPSYAIPERILDEAEQEISVEMTDKELLQYEKENEMEDDEGEDEEESSKTVKESKAEDTAPAVDVEMKDGDQIGANVDDGKSMGGLGFYLHFPQYYSSSIANCTPITDDDWGDGELDFSNLPVDKIRRIIAKDGPYYPVVEGSTNPYRDGYVTEPPKKPRPSYLFFQAAMRSYFQKRNPDAVQSELMTMLGDQWRMLSDEEKLPFTDLAKEEAQQFDREKAMLEKAQKPNEVWQPLRRCSMVLERVAEDSFADIFLEPVDREDFPDYDEIIDSPMDLGTIRQRLKDRHYMACEQFARDMRRVWNNCKIYNQHGSAIWHVADYMSKLFERLYHAWVLEFRERYIRWADPRARPWEHTCRAHDGKCKTVDHEMVLCDHCDAMYGIKCTNPPLKKIPSKAWHCPECKPKLRTPKGARMLSAVAENAARKRAEFGDIPKKTVKQTMYLVKWEGLGYEFCTWETRQDVNDDSLISKFHSLNNTFPDDADLSGKTLRTFLEDIKHINVETAGGVSIIPELRSQLYAQTRSFQFLKFGEEIPVTVAKHCGPSTQTLVTGIRDGGIIHPKEVLECISEMVFSVARGDRWCLRRNNVLPPPLTGEYDAIIPITSKGLMMNVGEIHGHVAFLGYRKFPDGKSGPAEKARLIRSVGDKIIAVDGAGTAGKSFKEVIEMLRASGKNKFAFMRFLDNQFAASSSELASTGIEGQYAISELGKKFSTDRQRVVIQRSDTSEENEVAENLLPDEEENSDSEEESEQGSEGEFEPDSEDEDLGGGLTRVKEVSDDVNMDHSNQIEAKTSETAEPDEADGAGQGTSSTAAPVEEAGKDHDALQVSKEKEEGPTTLVETTRSLGLRLLDQDLEYSSDEGGDEDCAYFIDGMDSTYTRLSDVLNLKQEEESVLPARQSEFAAQGSRGKLTAAVCLTSEPPLIEDVEHFPQNRKKEVKPESVEESPSKIQKRSTVKVQQSSLTTGEIIHVWPNAEAAAATLQIPLNDLRAILRGEYEEMPGDELAGYKWQFALAGAKVTAGTSNSSRGGKKAKEAWLEFRDKLYDPSEPHNYKNGNRLRDYQIDGVNWLASTWYKKHGCVLADEMGLGKTVQIVSYIEHLYRVEKVRRPHLVVVPLSTIEHWRREFEGWTDMVCCVYHDRQRVWRDVLREYEWYYEDRPHTPDFLKFDVLVTTYDTLIGDFDVIREIPFRVAVVDEAHRLRNQKGKLLECMKEISAKGTMQHGFQSRILISGTPLQNDLTELWTLLNFIEPFKFPDLDDFYAKFGNMANQAQVESLQQIISPYMLRRVKEDVAKDIPAKEETLIDVELTSVQKQYYRAIFEHNHAFLSLGNSRNVAPKLMNIQMELRKACNHPFLLDGVEHRESERMFKELQEKGTLEGKSPEERQKMLNEHGYVMTSGKMILLDKLLPKLRAEGHKILIFSQMVKMLDLISEYCDFRGFRHERLDGRIRGTERQKSIDRFEKDPDIFVFLLSTRAGGVGINLTAADICIIFDSDWNPQNDIQAQARCHRIGQTKDVRIYRLITSRSFEQEMFERASRKLGLEQAVLGTFEKDKDDGKPSQKEMEQLLKRGAYALLDDDDDDANDFVADDIDAILKKRTRTRVVEGAKTSSWLNKAGMMVTKSKFSAEKKEDALDMDDPLFWQKVMPDFVTPSIMMKKFNDLLDEIEGLKRKGRGRRGRRKKSEIEQEKKEAEEAARAAAETKAKKEAEMARKESEGPMVNKDEGNDGPNADPVDETTENKADGIGETQGEEEDDDDKEGENDESDNEEEKDKQKKLSVTELKKVKAFMSELKSMLDDLDQDDDNDEGLTENEKAVCQKLLLTISVKDKIFSDEQRRDARIYLKRIEGTRRRRGASDRFAPGVKDDEPVVNAIPEALMIRGTAKKKRQKRRKTGDVVDEDGYLQHSDSEGEWSDIVEDIYDGVTKKKDTISRKEANRRRHWGAGDNEVTAAARAWPSFPRHVVNKVLSTLLELVIKDDEENGGVFSEPVSREDFPEYYETIEKPMDYGTMKSKLTNGEYRSALAFQKDFILILNNCRQFNDPSSEIVAEAKRQHLTRPKFLKEAAAKLNLFLGEDGTVLEITEEDTPLKKKRKRKDDDSEEKTKASSTQSKDNSKPRIKISTKGKKRSRSDDKDEDQTKAKRKKSDPKKTKKGLITEETEVPPSEPPPPPQDPSPEDDEQKSVFLDPGYWKEERKSLDGSYTAAKAVLTSLGPWTLPEPIIDTDFDKVAKLTISKTRYYDRKYELFSEQVSQEEYPDYYEIVKEPMCFQRMLEKIENKEYGSGSHGASALYYDFLLMFDNAILYNGDDSEVGNETARIMGYLPEAYALACSTVAKRS